MHPSETFQCKQCGKYFGRKHSLEIHMRSHEAAKFKCSYCEKVLKSEQVISDQSIHSVCDRLLGTILKFWDIVVCLFVCMSASSLL